MKRKASFFLGLVLATIAFSLGLAAEDLKPVKLPAPQTDGGRPLMQVLKDRKSTREFGPAKLSPQTLSNLLWAAFGINRPDGRRTAPSAMNWQEVGIYVATPEGVYIYDAKDNALNPVLAGDFRAATGTQSFVKDAAVNLVYVSDLSKTDNAASTEAEMYTAADVGFIAQNVYLYCASEGLVTVVRASIDTPALAKTLKLQPQQKIILAQSVGYGYSPSTQSVGRTEVIARHESGKKSSRPGAQAACCFRCSASKRTPFFQTSKVMAEILRANVRRAIDGFIPRARQAS